MSESRVDVHARSDARRGVEARDAGLRRLSATTKAVVAAAVALTGAFAGLAAASVPGRKLGPVPRARAIPPPAVPAPRVVQSGGSPAAGGGSAGTQAAPAPAPPPAPPVQVEAPPVVVSGGS